MPSDRGALALRARDVFTTLMARSTSRKIPYTSTGIKMGLASSGAGIAAGTGGANSDDNSELPPTTTDQLDVKKEVDDAVQNGSVIKSLGEQMSFGGVLGFAAGYSIRKVGKAMLFLVGTEVVILQYMAYKEWLTMDWRRLARDLSPKLNRSTWEGLFDILVYRMPFSAAFSGGLLAGLRMSSKK